MIIDPNTPIYAFYRVVFQVIRPIFCNKDKFSIVRKSVHIILNPVCTIIRCFSVNSKICSNRDTQIIKAVSNILDLTLFPRVSETSETNLRNQRLFMLLDHIIHPRAAI